MVRVIKDQCKPEGDWQSAAICWMARGINMEQLHLTHLLGCLDGHKEAILQTWDLRLTKEKSAGGWECDMKMRKRVRYFYTYYINKDLLILLFLLVSLCKSYPLKCLFIHNELGVTSSKWCYTSWIRKNIITSSRKQHFQSLFGKLEEGYINCLHFVRDRVVPCGNGEFVSDYGGWGYVITFEETYILEPLMPLVK